MECVLSTVRVFAATPDRDDGYNVFLVINVIDHTPVADANPPTFQAAQLPTPPWTWIILELQGGLSDAAKIRLADAVQLTVCLLT